MAQAPKPWERYGGQSAQQPSSSPVIYSPPKPTNPFEVSREERARRDQEMQERRDAEQREQNRIDNAQKQTDLGIKMEDQDMQRDKNVRDIKGQQFSDERKLATEFQNDPAYKEYQTSVRAYSTSLDTKPNPQGDQTLITNYAKMLDPTSVVRETEFDITAGNEGWLARNTALLAKEFGYDPLSGMLSAEGRVKMRDEMHNMVVGYNQNYNSRRQYYRDAAAQYGFNPELVVGPHLGAPFYDNVKDYRESIGGRPVASPQGQTEIVGGLEKRARESSNEENALFFQQAYGHSYEADQAFTQWLNANIGRELTPEQIDAQKQALGIQSGWDDSAILAQRHLQVGAPDENGQIRLVNWGGNPLDAGREKALAQMAKDDPRGEAGGGDLAKQGFTFGLSDEASGIGAGIGAFLKGESFGDAYTTARAYEGERLNQARENMGGWGTAAELLGGVASGGGLLKGASGAGRAASSPIIQGARAGATGGAVAGFGYAEPGQGFQGAVGGALAGGALGGAIPAIGSAVRPTYNALLRATGRAKNIPIDQVRNALAADLNTPSTAGRMVQDAQSRGVPMTLADTGDNTRALLGSVTRQRGPSKTMGMQTIVQRQEGQMERLSEAVRRDLGPTANLQDMGEALMDKAKAEAGPLYDAAYNKAGAGAIFPKIEPLLQRPSVKKALERARRIAAEEGEDPTALGFDIDAQGEVVLTRVPSFKTLDYAKRGMDDVVETYRDKTSGKLVLDTEGRAVNGTLRQFLSIVDKANPEYAAARSAYAGPARMRDAMEKGAKAFTKAPDILEAEMKGLGAAEKEMYRLGVRKAMIDALAGKGDYADKVATLSRTPKVRAALTKVFGSGPKVNRFFKTLEDEGKLFQTYKEVATGSPTASRLAFDATTDDSSLAGSALAVANTAKQGGVFAAVGDILGRVREAGQLGAGKAGDAARESIAALLTEANPAELVLIQQAARRAAARQRLLKSKEVVKSRRQGGATSVGAITATENLRAE